VLIGCAVGCGALVLIGVASCIGFAVWLNQPGDVLEPGRLLGDDTTGYVEWTLRLEDPGTREFVDLMIDQLQQTREGMPSPLPPFLNDRLVGMQNRRDERKLRRMFPMVLVWTVRPGTTADSDLHVLSASLRGLDHQLVLADWILGLFVHRAEEIRVVKHHGEKIFSFPSEKREPLSFFIHRGDLFFTSDVNTAQQAVDRLLVPDVSSGGAQALERWFSAAPAQPLHGAIDNQRGEVARLWRSHLDGAVDEVVAPEIWKTLGGVTLGGEFTAEGSFLGVVEFHFADPEQAGSAATPLREAVERVVGDTPLEVVGASQQTERVRLELEVAEIPGRLEFIPDLVDQDND
jgi:hypothetical protein